MDKKQLQWVVEKAGQAMEQGGNLDINLAASGLRQAAERYYALLSTPDFRPIQQSYNLIMATREG